MEKKDGSSTLHSEPPPLLSEPPALRDPAPETPSLSETLPSLGCPLSGAPSSQGHTPVREAGSPNGGLSAVQFLLTHLLKLLLCTSTSLGTLTL